MSSLLFNNTKNVANGMHGKCLIKCLTEFILSLQDFWSILFYYQISKMSRLYSLISSRLLNMCDFPYLRLIWINPKNDDTTDFFHLLLYVFIYFNHDLFWIFLKFWSSENFDSTSVTTKVCHPPQHTHTHAYTHSYI